MKRLRLNEHEIWVLPSAGALASAGAEVFLNCAGEAVTQRGLFSVMLSGGSTPKAMYRILASPKLRDQVPWKVTHVFWGDERMVPLDSPDSNYRMAFDAFLKLVPIPSEQIHRVRTELGTPEQVADDYQRQLEAFARLTGLSTEQPPSFDLTLLGLGDDGHTASLFPGISIPSEGGRWVIAPWVPKLGAHRISVSPQVINSSRVVNFLVSGSEKASVLKRVLEGAIDTARYPAQLIGKALWMLDEQAGSLLEVTRGAAA